MLFYTIVVNAPFALATRVEVSVPIGHVAVEYLFVGVIALFVSCWWTGLLLLLAIAGDVLSLICRTFLLPPLDALQNISIVGSFTWASLSPIAAVLACAFAVIALAIAFPVGKLSLRQRRLTASCLLLFAALGLAIDYYNIAKFEGHLPTPWKTLTPTQAIKAEVRSEAIFRRPLLQLVHEQLSFSLIERVEKEDASRGAPVESASQIILPTLQAQTLAPGHVRPNVVLVLVESWGSASDSAWRASLTAPYDQPALRKRYKVTMGTVPFHGSTVAGESRELCNEDLGFNILSATNKVFNKCLPRQLERLGYHDLAAHGNSGYFFKRAAWWRRMDLTRNGFTRTF